jgi:predicted RNA binding protein YcfA (HicA-like mRNA interferase family)
MLSQHGFVQVRQRGSHIVMQRSVADGTATVPVPDHAELRLGTLQSIIRQSGIARSVFES